MKQIQILKNKTTGEVMGWCAGQAFMTNPEAETLVKNISDKIFSEIVSGNYDITIDASDNVQTTKKQSVADQEAEKTARTALRQKFINKTASQDDIFEALSKLL